MAAEYDLIGPWSEVKLEILREYARPFCLIVRKNGLYPIYVDGFAGPGEHISRTTGEPVAGSPLNALRAQPPFLEYHFIDSNPERAAQLRAYPSQGMPVYVYAGDCNTVLLNEVFPKIRYEQRHRAVCLLDPYNIDLSWTVVAEAGRMRSVEIFVNFMVMDMNMNVLLRNPDKAGAEQVARMNRFWGDDSWRSAAYEEDRQGTLFGSPGRVKVDEANEKIAAAYSRRLIDVAGFGYSARPLAFVNEKGRTIYYLCFASQNATGLKIVEDIFSKHRRKQRL